MSKRFILAIDQGTTSSRAVLFDDHWSMVTYAQLPITQHYPQPGYVEHDAEEIWSTTLACARKVLAIALVDPSDIAGVAITNQRETVVAWDSDTGEVLTPAIVWQCRRTAPLCARLKSNGLEESFHRRTGLVLDPYFSGTKIAWLLENTPGLWGRALKGGVKFGTIDSFLLYRLTGGKVHATDVTNASRTLLFNLKTGDYDPDLLKLLNVPECALPEVRPTASLFGETEPGLFGAPIPIFAMCGDQQAALFGQCCFEPGDVKNTYGTGCFLLMNIGREAYSSNHGLLTTVAWQLEGEPLNYALEGSVFMGGAVVQWLRDELGLISNSAESEPVAESVNDTGGVVLVPAFTGLGAPYWNSEARGTLVGLTRGTGRAHIVRAALESIAQQNADVLAVMQEDAVTAPARIRVDGGAAQNGWLMQYQADVCGVTVERAAVAESTARGAAALAGIMAGMWSKSDLKGWWRSDTLFSPRQDANWRDSERSKWKRAVDTAVAWANDSAR
jgi:glycerol kinase